MSEEFVLEAPGKVIAGAGAVAKIAELLACVEKKSCVLLTDKGLRSSGIADLVAGLLVKSGWAVGIIDTIDREPGIQNANAIIKECRGIDCGAIIGIGGGSVLDLAKLVSCAYCDSWFLDGVSDTSRHYVRGIPSCLIPTTAGTGSEGTRNVILASEDRTQKNAIISAQFLPDYIVLDPELTISLPPAMTAATGIDAFAHALECFLSLRANPLSDLFAVDALKRIERSIEKAYINGKDIAARSDLLVGAFYGGLCISLSGTTAVHALSYPMGATFHVPHGVANAMLLAPVIDFNKSAVVEKLAVVGRVFSAQPGLTDAQASDIAVKRCYALVASLDIPKRMAEFGVTHSDIEAMVDGAIANRRLMDNNPKAMTRDDVRRIYELIQ